MGKVEKKDVLYTAFKGTKSWDRAIADLDTQLRHKDDIQGGTFHSVFEKRSRLKSSPPGAGSLLCRA